MSANDDNEVLAAEYVLGTLDLEERAQAQRLVMNDPAFAAAVTRWERRLGELNVLVAPVEPPPAILTKVKARMAGVEPPADEAPQPVTETAGADSAATAAAAAPPRPPRPVAPAESADIIDVTRRLKRWRGLAIGTGALAAAFVGLVVAREFRPDLMPQPLKPPVLERTVEVIKEVPSPKPARYVAVLQREAASPAFLLTFDLDKRVMMVRTVGAERQAGKSYELWLVSSKFPEPRSLGVIGGEEFTERPQLASYDAVTIEPEGGSPTGAPTSPVLYSGKLTQTTPPSFAEPSP